MSIIEYPKALYKGDLNQYEYKNADSKQQEEEMRADGWHDFNELKLPESTGTPIELTGISEQEHLDALEEIAKLEEELADFKGTHIAFLNNIQAMKDRIAELQGDDTPVGTVSYAVDYGLWTAEQLREEITKQGKEYKVRDSKAELIAILVES